MHITELEIDNFKSFAKRTKIPFFEGFSVISGPNGSGKSNIIDSILFCLALSSSRTLRAEKLTDLINLNSGKNTAEVTITFSDGTRIRRRIKRTSGSYYSYNYLNDRLCKQTDIIEFLARHGIKPHGYNVVMQGDITRIIEMGDIERRRIIDEIAGVSEFDSRKARALQELEVVRERIEREELLLHELGDRLKALGKEREKALQYREWDEKLTKLQSCRNAALLRDQEKELSTVARLITEQEAAAQRIDADRGLEENELSYLRADQKEVEEEINRKSGAEYMRLLAELEEAKGGIRIAEQTILRLQKDREANLTEQNRAFADLKRAETFVTECTAKVRSLGVDRANLAMEVATLRAQAEKLEGEIKQQSKDAESAREQLFSLMQEAETKKGERSRLLQTQDLLLEKSRMRTREHERLIERARALSVDIASRDSAGGGREAELAEKEETCRQLERQIATAEAEAFASRTTLERIRQELRQHEQEVMRLEALQHARGEAGGRALEAVRGLDGVFGTIAELGKVPKEYATALNTAAGGRLGYVVVENDTVAADAIRLLKDQRLGRLTFLPLNKLKPPAAGGGIREEGIIGYAINLLEFDRKFEDAFRVVFAGTVVVDTLDHARRLLGRFRMVTLEGELLEKTGAITGGVARKTAHGFGAAVEDDIGRIRARMGGILAEASEVEEAVRERSELVERLRSERRATDEEAGRIRIALEEGQRSAETIRKDLSETREAIMSLEREVEGAAAELAGIEAGVATVSQAITELTRRVEVVKKSLESTAIPGLTEAFEKKRHELEETERRLRNKDADITDLQRERQHFQARVTELTDEGQRLATRNQEIDREAKDHALAIERFRESIAAIEERQKQFSGEIEHLRHRRDELAAEAAVSEEKIRGFQLEREKVGVQLTALAERQRTIEEKIAELRIVAGSTGTTLTLAEIEDGIVEATAAIRQIGAVNMLAIEEYDQVRVRIEERTAKKETLSRERSDILQRIEYFEKMKFEAFMTSFRVIDANFREIFARLTSGSGNLVLEKEEDPFSGGLSFAVKPRDKPVHLLSALSGGEKSLTTLAFIFSIQQHMPAPFYAFDEVDMSLDGSNVERIAEMIRSLAGNSQFIIVSLRKPMIDGADRIMGVTLRPDKSSLVTGVKLHG